MRKCMLIIMFVLLFIPSVHAMMFGGDEPGCRNDMARSGLTCVLEKGQPINNFELLDMDNDNKALIRVDAFISKYDSTYLAVYDHIIYTNSSDNTKMKLTVLGTGYSNNSRIAVMINFKSLESKDALYGDGVYCLNIYDYNSKFKGGITYLDKGFPVTKADYCVDRHTVFDYNCLGSQPNTCRESNICKNGTCVFHVTLFQKLRAYWWMMTLILRNN